VPLAIPALELVEGLFAVATAKCLLHRVSPHRSMRQTWAFSGSGRAV
jgi:hypothetical protein